MLLSLLMACTAESITLPDSAGDLLLQPYPSDVTATGQLRPPGADHAPDAGPFYTTEYMQKSEEGNLLMATKKVLPPGPAPRAPPARRARPSRRRTARPRRAASGTSGGGAPRAAAAQRRRVELRESPRSRRDSSRSNRDVSRSRRRSPTVESLSP